MFDFLIWYAIGFVAALGFDLLVCWRGKSDFVIADIAWVSALAIGGPISAFALSAAIIVTSIAWAWRQGFKSDFWHKPLIRFNRK